MNLNSETYLEVEEYDEFPPTYACTVGAGLIRNML
jgi:hypothetical protein